MKTLTNSYLATLLLSMTARTAMADRPADPTQPVSRRPGVRYSRAGETHVARLQDASMQVRHNVVHPKEAS